MGYEEFMKREGGFLAAGFSISQIHFNKSDTIEDDFLNSKYHIPTQNTHGFGPFMDSWIVGRNGNFGFYFSLLYEFFMVDYIELSEEFYPYSVEETRDTTSGVFVSVIIGLVVVY